MDMLDLKDAVERGSYRSDRFTAVPWSTIEDVMAVGQKVMTADDEHDEWSGVVSPSCSDHTDVVVVSRKVGIGLRIGGEANLCFKCGPDGGHYHPSNSMDEVAKVATRLSAI